MTVEHIEKKVIVFSFDKHGKCREDETITYPIDFDIIVNTNELPSMCNDLIDLLKDDNVFTVGIVCPVSVGFTYEVRTNVFDLKYIKEIVFEDYYLKINGKKIFYNSIFDFKKLERW